MPLFFYPLPARFQTVKILPRPFLLPDTSKDKTRMTLIELIYPDQTQKISALMRMIRSNPRAIFLVVR